MAHRRHLDVRGAHYPHDPRMMDRLDEAGIVFWSETIGPSVYGHLDIIFDHFSPMSHPDLSAISPQSPYL